MVFMEFTDIKAPGPVHGTPPWRNPLWLAAAEEWIGAECALAGAVSGAFACGAHGTCEEQIAASALAEAMGRAARGPEWAGTTVGHHDGA